MAEPNTERPTGASTQCPHSDLHFHLNNAGFGNTNLHYLEITARCKICDQPARFRGPVGMSPNQAMTSLSGDEIRIPFLVGDEELTGKPMSYGVRQVS